MMTRGCFWMLFFVLLVPGYAASQDYGTPPEDEMRSTVGARSTLILSDDSTDQTLTGSLGNLNLVSDDDVVVPSDTVRGPATGCTTGTELFLDGAAMRNDGTDYDTDFMEAGCANGLVLFADDGFTTTQALCRDDPAVDFMLIAGFSFGDDDDIRLCLIDFSVPFEGPAFGSILIPESDSCEALIATLEGFGMPAGAVVDFDDDDYFTYNAVTCTYDFTPDAGLSVVSGWTSPPTVSTDSAIGYAWSVDTAGDAVFSGHVAIDEAEICSQRTVIVESSWTNPNIVGVNANIVLAFEGTGTCEALETCGAVGIQGSIGAGGAGDWEFGYGIAATAAYTGSGTAFYFLPLWAALGHYGTGDITEGNAIYAEYFIQNDGDLIDGAVIKIESPTISAATSGVSHNPVAIRIEDQSCDHNACDIDRVTGVASGLKIAEFSDPNDWGIWTFSPILIEDDVLLNFGTHADVALSSSTVDQLDISPNTDNGDVTLNVVGTGALILDADVELTGGLSLLDDEKIVLGTGSDAEIYYDETTTDELRIDGANVAIESDLTVEGDLLLEARLVVSVEDVTCGEGTNVCAYNASVVTTRLTSDDGGGADVVTVTDGIDGQRRTFILAVDGTNNVTIDVSTNGNGTDSTLADAGDSVTYEYDSTNDTWWIIASHGL